MRGVRDAARATVAVRESRDVRWRTTRPLPPCPYRAARPTRWPRRRRRSSRRAARTRRAARCRAARKNGRFRRANRRRGRARWGRSRKRTARCLRRRRRLRRIAPEWRQNGARIARPVTVVVVADEPIERRVELVAHRPQRRRRERPVRARRREVAQLRGERGARGAEAGGGVEAVRARRVGVELEPAHHRDVVRGARVEEAGVRPVSYTHLTLPTTPYV